MGINVPVGERRVSNRFLKVRGVCGAMACAMI